MRPEASLVNAKYPMILSNGYFNFCLAIIL